MIKGIIALFTSGLFFTPQVFFGIILGFILGYKYTPEEVINLYCKPIFYALVTIIFAMYIFIFKRSYKDSMGSIDWIDLITQTLGRVVVFYISNAATLSLIYSFFV